MVNRKILLSLFLLLPFLGLQAEESLQLHYDFQLQTGTQGIADISGNAYDAELKNGAELLPLGKFSVLSLGDKDGYVDMGEKTGELIGTLEDFSVALYVYIEPEANITGNGNFIWTFANSDNIASAANGNMFYSAKDQRYAISERDYSAESTFGLYSNFPKGEWKHLVYAQQGSAGYIYMDGEEVSRGSIRLTPSQIVQDGKTLYNFIGRACYSGDDYLKNTYIADFRIYNEALGREQIDLLMSDKPTLVSEYTAYEIEQVKDLLFPEGIKDVKNNIELPYTIGKGIEITWESRNTDYLSDNGEVTQPDYGEEAVIVVLTATLSKNGVSLTKDIDVTILPDRPDTEAVALDVAALSLNGRIYIREQIDLPQAGEYKSTIEWVSSHPQYLNNEGIVEKLPAVGEGDLEVVLTAKVSRGEVSEQKEFTVVVPESEDYVAYLFAYFTGNSGNQEAIRFAISYDGHNYTALNKNEPIIDSEVISAKGGVRDPHILRGEDGKFYMVVTDMKSSQGWQSNHGIVMLKSDNLVDWTWSRIDIKEKYPEFAKITRAWAPQTIYDPEAGKYMIYLSLYHSPGPDIIYYSYADEDFTTLETTPEVLFTHPDGLATIDGDIIYKDGKYHIFFKDEGYNNGVMKAVSKSVSGGYVVQGEYYQQTEQAVEGACVFRLINSDKYILMYDVYTNGRYEFAETTDLENFTLIPQSKISMDFHPRHGTVIPIKQSELDALRKKWDPAYDGIESDKSSVNKEIKIYPNPAQHVFRVEFSNSSRGDITVSIYNSIGTLVERIQDNKTGDIYSEEFSLNVQDGIYFVHIEDGNNNMSAKLIIRK